MTLAPMSLETQEVVRNSVGRRITVRAWRPFPSPRAVVVVCHDPNAHGGIDGWSARRLVDAGCAVYGLNVPGRECRACEPPFAGSLRNDLDDLSAVIEWVRTQEADRPTFLLGHSAVGAVVRTFAVDRRAELAGLVGESFVHKIPPLDKTEDTSLRLRPEHSADLTSDVGGAETLTGSMTSLDAGLATG